MDYKQNIHHLTMSNPAWKLFLNELYQLYNKLRKKSLSTMGVLYPILKIYTFFKSIRLHQNVLRRNMRVKRKQLIHSKKLLQQLIDQRYD